MTAAVAERWIERWDRQQETYLSDREQRFAVIADVVEATSGRPDPLIVDLGCGPGSLAVRLIERLPGASVVGIDADPLLLGLARDAFGGYPGLRVVDRDLRTPGWERDLDLPNGRSVDAVVSTTALHWLTGPELADTYAVAGRLLRPGGVLVNGDHLREGSARPELDRLTRLVRDRLGRRAGTAEGEEWDAWWRAVAEEPALAGLMAERTARRYEHTEDPGLGYDDHVTRLRAAGFAEIGTVWQAGDDRVLVAVR